jgi:nicotinamidase-related amidase
MSKFSITCRSGRIYQFSPDSTALLLIDLQKEFFIEEEDSDGLDEMRAIIPRVARLLSMARSLRCRVIHTRETYQPDLSDVNAYRRSLGYVGKPGPLYSGRTRSRICRRGQTDPA